MGSERAHTDEEFDRVAAAALACDAITEAQLDAMTDRIAEEIIDREKCAVMAASAGVFRPVLIHFWPDVTSRTACLHGIIPIWL